MNLRPAYILATGFGTGHSPYASGTVGSALALAIFLPALHLPLWAQLILVALALALGLAICGKIAQDLQQKDPSIIVWDEFTGMWLAMLALPPGNWQAIAAAFFLFRLLDIIKPWPANWADQRLPGAPGIMLDDVAAGGYTLLAVHALLWLGWLA